MGRRILVTANHWIWVTRLPSSSTHKPGFSDDQYPHLSENVPVFENVKTNSASRNPEVVVSAAIPHPLRIVGRRCLNFIRRHDVGSFLCCSFVSCSSYGPNMPLRNKKLQLLSSNVTGGWKRQQRPPLSRLRIGADVFESNESNTDTRIPIVTDLRVYFRLFAI